MPISKEMARRYPADWKTRRRFIIQYRAGNRCEWCLSTRTASLTLKPAATWSLLWPMCGTRRRRTRRCLNLACLCQRCHNRWDAVDPKRMSRIRSRVARLLRSGQLPLPWPPGVSMAMEIYQLLIETGQLTPPEYQLPIPREAYEYVA